MSRKLDQSLDQIMADSKAAGNGPAGRRRGHGRKPNKPSAAPAAGVQKNTKSGKAVAKVVQALSASLTSGGDSKIIVSNLPDDVHEHLIQDFFNKSVGHVKKVTISYNANGRSRGEATILFSDPGCAALAAKNLSGVRVDNRPMKIEVVALPKPAPVKKLQDRITKPKVAESKKDKNVPKAAVANGTGKAKGKKGKKGGLAGRPKRKTAAELDADMQDYWNTNNAANGNAAPAAAPATTGADTGMTDEVM